VKHTFLRAFVSKPRGQKHRLPEEVIDDIQNEMIENFRQVSLL
jgi:hypothetical protein